MENKIETEEKKKQSGEKHLSVVSSQFISNGTQPIPMKD